MKKIDTSSKTSLELPQLPDWVKIRQSFEDIIAIVSTEMDEDGVIVAGTARTPLMEPYEIPSEPLQTFKDIRFDPERSQFVLINPKTARVEIL